MADGRWQMADGRWQMADGKWQMVDGRWQMADDKWQMADDKCQMANGGWHLESSASQEPHSVDDGRPPLAAEGQGGGDAFAGWAGDGEGWNALAAGSQPRDAWSVHHEDRAVHDLAHLRHDRGVAGVQDRGVPEFVLALPGQGDGPIDVRDP